MARVMLAAGGTGGHIFPALAVAEVLEAQGYEVTLLTDKRGVAMVEGKISYHVISAASPFAPAIGAKLIALLKLGFGFAQSLLKMIFQRPKAVIGFGGYPSFAPLFAARLLSIPVTLHEQNAVMGRANRMLAKSASQIALSFAETKNAPKHAVMTGLPVRAAFHNIAPYQPAKTCHITIIGGSLGAQIFADIVPDAIAALPDDMRQHITLSQQARDEHVAPLSSAYKSLGVQADVARFFHDIAALYEQSDIIISRAGASSVQEISAAGRAAILVPFAGALDDHQTGNAMRLVEAGGAIMMAETDASAAKLAASITQLVTDKKARLSMAQKASQLASTHAAFAIAKLTGLPLTQTDPSPIRARS